jgi:hypothetical protein
MEEKKANINPDGPPDHERKPINPSDEVNPTVGPSHLRIPHVGRKKVIRLDLFNTGPFRGGSLGRTVKKK